MKNYIDELVRERENDTKTVQNIMLSVSPYYQKRILNDALQAYAMYINEEIENIPNEKVKEKVVSNLKELDAGARDFRF